MPIFIVEEDAECFPHWSIVAQLTGLWNGLKKHLCQLHKTHWLKLDLKN